jgi:hypothetical protein
VIAPEIAALLAQQSKAMQQQARDQAVAMQQQAQIQAQAMQQQAQALQAMMEIIAKMPAQGAHVVAPPIITVVATQTDAKRVALQRVQAILQLFEPSRRALAWKVSELDAAGEPLAYDMERAMERVREIMVQRGGRLASLPTKPFLTNCSLLLFDYGGEGLSMEDFNPDKPKKIAESWERFSAAYFNMSYVLGEFVNPVLGMALNTLYVNLTTVHTTFTRMKTSALVYAAQQLLGKLKTMEQLPSPEDVNREVIDTLQLTEGTKAFQQLINRELMGAGAESRKRSPDLGDTPPPGSTKKQKQAAKPTHPTLQGAYPCYSWIKQVSCCRGPTCNAPKKKGLHPHKFDPLDKGAAEKEFRDWVEKYM